MSESSLHTFTASVLGSRDDASVSWLETTRANGARQASGLSVPTAKHEEWRFTKLRRLTDQVFCAAPEATIDASLVDQLATKESAGARLVFVNGRYQSNLSDTSAIPASVYVGSAASLDGAELGAVTDAFGQPSSFYDDVFKALNDACASDVACIVVPPDTAVDTPIHLLFVTMSSDDAFSAAPRTLVVAGRGSKVGLVEEYCAPEGGLYFNNALTEVTVGESAKVEHVRVQRESDEAFHLGRHAVRLGRNAHYDSVSVSYGAAWSRIDAYAAHQGEGTWCRIDGLALIRDEQVADTHSVIDNQRPHCESHQLHKIIADGKAAGVFNGKIFVREGAQKIDAYQLNRNLLLSKGARVDTKPQLEILADDVKCSHGATIGQLDDEQLFYLVSRGFTPSRAKGLLTYAFAAEVLEQVHVDSLKKALEREAALRVQ